MRRSLAMLLRRLAYWLDPPPRLRPEFGGSPAGLGSNHGSRPYLPGLLVSANQGLEFPEGR